MTDEKVKQSPYRSVYQPLYRPLYSGLYGPGSGSGGASGIQDQYLDFPLFWYSDGDGSGGLNPPPPVSSIFAPIEWDEATQNTNATAYIDPESYRVAYGRVTGIYTDQIDLSSTFDNKAGLRFEVSGQVGGTDLAVNDDVYCVVQSIDAHGNVSAQSSEVMATARLRELDTAGFTPIGQAEVGTTLSSGGYILTEDVTVSSGVGYSLGAGAVLALNGFTITYGVSARANALVVNGSANGAEVHGPGLIQQGAYVGAATEKMHAIDADFAAQNDVVVDGVTFNLTQAGDGANRAIAFYSENITMGTGFRFTNNTVTANSTSDPMLGGMGAIFIKNELGRAIITDNTVTLDNMNRNGSRPRMFFCNSAVYGRNTMIFGPNVVEAQGFVMTDPSSGNFYVHDNVVVDNGEQTRVYLQEAECDNVYILWENVTANRTTTLDPDASAVLRFRYSSQNMVVGYMNIDGAGSTDTYLFRLGGHEDPTYNVPPSNVHMYRNTCVSGDRRALSFEGGMFDVFSWENTWNGGADVDIFVDAGGPAFPATDTINFQSKDDTLVNSTVTNLGGANTWTIENSFAPGDVSGVGGTTGMTFGPSSIFPSAKTPNAPTNVRAV